IYLSAGVLTVTAVVVTLPLALIPTLNGLGWALPNDLPTQSNIAIVTLVLITLLNMYGVKLVSIVNNMGVIFEILGMVVFAVIPALAHSPQGLGVIFPAGDAGVTAGSFL